MELICWMIGSRRSRGGEVGGFNLRVCGEVLLGDRLGTFVFGVVLEFLLSFVTFILELCFYPRIFSFGKDVCTHTSGSFRIFRESSYLHFRTLFLPADKSPWSRGDLLAMHSQYARRAFAHATITTYEKNCTYCYWELEIKSCNCF